jgi:hypothetical protein
MSIPTTFRLFRVLTSEQIGRRLRCLRYYWYPSICLISEERYQLNYFICIKDFNAETITSLKLNLFSFLICCCQYHETKTICLYIFLISDIYWGTSNSVNTEVACRFVQTSRHEKDGTWSELTWFETTVLERQIVFVSWYWQQQIRKENKFNFKEVIVSALKSLIQIK